MTGLSLIVPANDEEAGIAACLGAVLASDWPAARPLQIVVVANGCVDATADTARRLVARATARGWQMQVIELARGGKTGALDAGDRAARHPVRAYLDADVTVSPALLSELHAVLARPAPAYASGRLRIAPAHSAVTRAYARIYARVPFIATGVPGCGLFAMNAAGRARWGDWPAIISDDTFARLHFAPAERHGVPAPYIWPLVEGWRNLVRVRARQNAGVADIAARFPALTENDDPRPFPLRDKMRLALRHPLGFAIYAGVAIAVRLRPGNRARWTRGR